MDSSFTEIQPALAYAAEHLEDDLSLAELAEKTGLSPFHFHRVFSAAVGETPKQITFRLRLSRAAVLLLNTRDSVLDIALSCGFQSHESFSRAFRKRFSITPSAYRKRGFTNRPSKGHAVIVDTIAPCIGLYSRSKGAKTNDMAYTVTKQKLQPQPVLIMRRRVKRTDIASTITEVLPRIFMYAQQNGIALVGLPITRYVEVGPGLLTIEPGMRVAAPASDNRPSDSEILWETLPGGPAAMTTHLGQYDKLTDAYGAIEQWIESEGLTAGGAPWECYMNSPAECPDPKDWKTEVYWPLAG